MFRSNYFKANYFKSFYFQPSDAITGSPVNGFVCFIGF